MADELEKIFISLGFSNTQLTAYTALAGQGKASASQLMKITNLPRSTIYSALDSLVPSGLVSIDESSTIRFFVANAPDSLKRHIEREKNEANNAFKLKESLAESASQMLKPFFQGQVFSVPKMQFFEGEANVEGLLWENYKLWQESVAQYDCVWWGYQDHEFVVRYRKWLDHYWSNMFPEERVKLLSNKSPIEKKLKGKIEKRTIKTVPAQFEFSSTIWVLGDYIISISTRQKPHYAFQIKDSAFSENLRKMFQMHWAALS
jgi:sugar-specific transcriptional regulator TrmB